MRILILFLVILFVSCQSDLPPCNEPNVRIGLDCCRDGNNNRECDDREPTQIKFGTAIDISNCNPNLLEEFPPLPQTLLDSIEACPGIEDRGFCYNELFNLEAEKENPNLHICEQMAKPELYILYERCYSLFAAKLDNQCICALPYKYAPELAQTNCWSEMGKALSDETYCDMLPRIDSSTYVSYLRECYSTVAINKSDVQICSKMPDFVGRKWNCYVDVAVKLLDPSVCPQEYISECRGFVDKAIREQ